MANMKRGQRYDESFKREAVVLVLEQKIPYTRAARQVGVVEETLRQVAKSGPKQQEDSEKTDKERQRELERENRLLRQERDILKEAVVYSFVRHIYSKSSETTFGHRPHGPVQFEEQLALQSTDRTHCQ